MTLFRMLFAVSTLFVLVLGYFYVDGLQYAGSSGSSALWLPVLGIPMLMLAGGWILHKGGRTKTANVLLGLLAIPALLYVAFFAVMLIAEPSWH